MYAHTIFSINVYRYLGAFFWDASAQAVSRRLLQLRAARIAPDECTLCRPTQQSKSKILSGIGSIHLVRCLSWPSGGGFLVD